MKTENQNPDELVRDQPLSVPNWECLRALMAWSDHTYLAKHEGVRLVSNGHVAFAVPPEVEFKLIGREHAALGKLWAESLLVPIAPLQPGRCVLAEGVYSREIGLVAPLWIGEQYFRCFASDETTWTRVRNLQDMLLIHWRCALVGIVMPRKVEGTPEALLEEPSLREVFGPYSCEQNQWYLVDKKTLAGRIDKCRREIARCREAIEDLEEERTVFEVDLRNLERRLAELQTT